MTGPEAPRLSPRDAIARILCSVEDCPEPEDLALADDVLLGLDGAGYAVVPIAEHEALLKIAGTRAPRQPSLAQVKAYMLAKGWQEHPPGRFGAMWTRPATKPPWIVAVPAEDGDARANAGVVERVARAEGRKVHQVIRDMLAAAP